MIIGGIIRHHEIKAYYHRPQLIISQGEIAGITDLSPVHSDPIDNPSISPSPVEFISVTPSVAPTPGFISQPSPQPSIPHSPTPIASLTSINPSPSTLLSTPAIPPTPTPSPQPQLKPTPTPTTQSEPIEKSLNQAVNDYRQDLGKSPIQDRDDLCELASVRAQEAHDEFNHDKFNLRAQSGELDYLQYTEIAENIWQGTPVSTDRIIQGWHDSSSHRQTMQDDWNYGCGAIHQNTAAFIFMN